MKFYQIELIQSFHFILFYYGTFMIFFYVVSPKTLIFRKPSYCGSVLVILLSDCLYCFIFTFVKLQHYFTMFCCLCLLNVRKCFRFSYCCVLHTYCFPIIRLMSFVRSYWQWWYIYVSCTCPFTFLFTHHLCGTLLVQVNTKFYKVNFVNKSNSQTVSKFWTTFDLRVIG